MSGTNYQVTQHNIPDEHMLVEEYLLEKLDILRSVYHFVIYTYIVQQDTQCGLNE